MQTVEHTGGEGIAGSACAFDVMRRHAQARLPEFLCPTRGQDALDKVNEYPRLDAGIEERPSRGADGGGVDSLISAKGDSG
jgi:hypothetical protein